MTRQFQALPKPSCEKGDSMRARMTILCVILLAWTANAAALSDVVRAPRPSEGEYLGLYLKGQKIGYMFRRLSLSAKKDSVTAVTQVFFKAKVGAAVSSRTMKETRVYEAKPNGALLSFVMEQDGDGGTQRLEGVVGAKELKVVRKRPGEADEVKLLPVPHDVVEDADQPRVALFRNAAMNGSVLDLTDLQSYALTSTVGGSETRVVGGVTAKLRKVTSISQKEKVPVDAFIDEKGRLVEEQYGPMMTGRLESEEAAKRVDLVEVFGLTRVVLPQPAPASAKAVPGAFTMVLSGVDKKFWNNTFRQQWKPLDGGQVEVTVRSAIPKVTQPRPLMDPNGGANLKATLSVESTHPAIVAKAQELAGTEKDAWAVAKKINQWVFTNLEKDYGASSDSAGDVLKRKKGDCTEHSLLTVSMLRALGIPAKRVDGLIYLMNDDNVPALYWHEWVEVYVGEWVQMDPTFGQDIANPARLAVGEESNAEITPLIGSMKVVSVR